MTETKTISYEEQIAERLPAMAQMLPTILEVAKVYQDAFPAATTPDEVQSAVTVPLPLKAFLVMTSLSALLCLIERDRRAAASADS